MSARKKLIHAMPLNTDRAINRAMVVGCAISATRNYLKLHMPRTLIPLLCNIHAETRKLRKRSAMRVAASRPGAARQSSPPPVDALRVSAEIPIALSWASLHADMHVGRCCARAYHRDRRRRAIPIALAASHCPTARDFVPWRFLVAGRFSAWSVSSFRRPKTCTKTVIHRLVTDRSLSKMSFTNGIDFQAGSGGLEPSRGT
jgi:hypothetical protein